MYSDRSSYVYAYLDPRVSGTYRYGDYEFMYEPFYIGKGSCGRSKRHLTGYCLEHDKNQHKVRRILKIRKEAKMDPVVVKVASGMTSEEALSLEVQLIEAIGRRDLLTGPLCNLTSGGDSPVFSKESIDKLRLSKLGIPRPQYVKDALRKANLGKKASIETRRKMSEERKGALSYWYGKHHSEAVRRKIGETKALRGQYKGASNSNAKWVYRVADSMCNVAVTVDLREYCVSRGLSYDGMRKAPSRGGRYKGHYVEAIPKDKYLEVLDVVQLCNRSGKDVIAPHQELPITFEDSNDHI